MSLKNFKLPTVDVQLMDGFSIAVRGLSTPDIEQLVRKYRPEAEALFAMVKDDKSDLSTLVSKALGMAPRVFGEVIAVATDEPDAVEEATKLPIGLQIKVLTAVVQMTFGIEGDPKKLGEVLSGLLNNLNPMLELASKKLGELEVQKQS